MIVYRDLLSGDEMLSDAFVLKEVTDTDGTVVSNYDYLLRLFGVRNNYIFYRLKAL